MRNSDSLPELEVNDPMRLYELVEFLQETYGVNMEDDTLTGANLDSIDNISRFLHERMSGNRTVEAPDAVGQVVNASKEGS
jgi:hypothetical protein